MKMKNLKQLITLFSNLIKVYHDGIIISSGENIILHNKQTASIFGTVASSNEGESSKPQFDSDGNP